MILCIDIVLTLHKPFVNGQRRIGWYHLAATIITIISFCFTSDEIMLSCEYTSICNKQYVEIEYDCVLAL